VFVYHKQQARTERLADHPYSPLKQASKQAPYVARVFSILILILISIFHHHQANLTVTDLM
jgi:hypothetical protein